MKAFKNLKGKWEGKDISKSGRPSIHYFLKLENGIELEFKTIISLFNYMEKNNIKDLYEGKK